MNRNMTCSSIRTLFAITFVFDGCNQSTEYSLIFKENTRYILIGRIYV